MIIIMVVISCSAFLFLFCFYQGKGEHPALYTLNKIYTENFKNNSKYLYILRMPQTRRLDRSNLHSTFASTRALAHTRTHARTHIRIAHAPARRRTHTHRHTHTHTHMHALSLSFSLSLSHTHTYINTHGHILKECNGYDGMAEGKRRKATIRNQLW